MSIELQNIDCNCNNCLFLERDFKTQNFWAEYHKNIQLDDYFKRKSLKIDEVIAQEKSLGKEQAALLNKALKYKFQFDKTGLINYGICNKYGKPISFIPNTCQIETQGCFVNRKTV